MSHFLKVVIGIFIAVVAGRLGITRLMYITLTFVSVFAAVSATKAFFTPLSSQLESITSHEFAAVLSFIILALAPLITIGYLGRKLINAINVDEDDISPMANAVLGAGYAVGVYLVLVALHII